MTSTTTIEPTEQSAKLSLWSRVKAGCKRTVTYFKRAPAVLLIFSILGYYLLEPKVQDHSKYKVDKTIEHIEDVRVFQRHVDAGLKKLMVVDDGTNGLTYYLYRTQDDKRHILKVGYAGLYTVTHSIIEPLVDSKKVPVTFYQADQLNPENAIAWEIRKAPTAPPMSATFKTALQWLYTLFTIAFSFFMIKMMMSQVAGRKFKVIMPADIKNTMDELIGMQDIKDELLHAERMIQNPSLIRQHGINRSFNLLLDGPPGTGKTKVVSALAKRLNMPMISTSGAELETGFIAGGSKTLNAIHEKALSMGRCLVFLDEGQAILAARGQSSIGGKFADDTPNTLLRILDGVPVRTFSEKFAAWFGITLKPKPSEVIWVVASNFNEGTMEMDAAVLRRFQIKVSFRMPNTKEREDILRFYLSKKDSALVNVSNADIKEIAVLTTGMSGALIENITDRASLMALQEGKIIDRNLLYRAYERDAIGLTDRETSANKDSDRERVAIHELGHFFAELASLVQLSPKPITLAEAKESMHTLKISTESAAKMGALGFVLSAGNERLLDSIEDLERRIVSLYGGVAAEELIYGDMGISTGSANDIEKATKLLTTMVTKLSMYSKSKLNHAMVAELTKSPLDESIHRELTRKSEELYRRALTAVETNLHDIHRIKQVLMDEYVIDKDRIFELLGVPKTEEKED